MRKTNTQTLGEALKSFFQENPFIAKKLAEQRLIDAWSKVMGKAAIKYTENLYIKNDTLYVKLSSSVFRNELSLCRKDLIEKLNNTAGTPVINEIIFN